MSKGLYEMLVRIFLFGCILFGVVALGGALLSMGPIGIAIAIGLGILVYKNKDSEQKS